MKILILSNFFPPDVIGGYELACLRIASALADRGHSIVVATTESRKSSVLSETDSRIKVCRVFRPIWDFEDRPHLERYEPFRIAKMLRVALADIPNSVTLRRLMDHDHFDVVYVFNLIGLGPLSMMETLLTAPIPRVVHLMDNIDTVIALKVRSAGLLSRFAVAKAQFSALSCSQGCLRRNSNLGTYNHAQVVFGGVESVPEATSPAVPRNPGPIRFGYHGQVVGHKGIRELIEAFSLVRARALHQPVELHLIGRIQEGYENEIDKYAGNDIRSGSVILHGSKSHAEAISLLKTMDLGVYPLAATEAFGYAPIECLACGVAAVVSRRAGASEMLPSRYPLFVSQRENIPLLSDVMFAAMSQPALRLEALNCFETSRQKYDFGSYSLPIIESALAQATHHGQVWSFPDTLQRHRTMIDCAFIRPASVFHGF